MPLLAPPGGDANREHMLLPPSRAAHRRCQDPHPPNNSPQHFSACPVDPGHLLSIYSAFDLLLPEEAEVIVGESRRDRAFIFTAQLLTNPKHVLDEDSSQVIAFQPSLF